MVQALRYIFEHIHGKVMTSWQILLLLLVLVAADVRTAVPSESSEQPFDPSGLIDRGAPIQPGSDQGVDPNRMGEEPQSVETRLQLAATKAGESNLVNCDVRAADGELIIDLQPVVYVEPDRTFLGM